MSFFAYTFIKICLTNSKLWFKLLVHYICSLVVKKECAKNAISSAAAKDINFEVTLPQNEIFIFANEQELTEVFKNLIINAIESVKTKGIDTPTIKIAIGISNKLCIFEITDNGCGIAKDNFKKVFLPFFTTKNRARNYGIGLSYVQSIVELYRGKINIASEFGEYTTFQLSFPIVSKKKGDKRWIKSVLQYVTI